MPEQPLPSRPRASSPSRTRRGGPVPFPRSWAVSGKLRPRPHWLGMSCLGTILSGGEGDALRGGSLALGWHVLGP